MKTVTIYDDKCEAIRFSVVDGDLSHLDGVYFNDTIDEKKINELSCIIFDAETGRERIEFTEVPPVDAIKDGAKIIVCEFMP